MNREGLKVGARAVFRRLARVGVLWRVGALALAAWCVVLLICGSAAFATFAPLGVWPQPTYHMKGACGVAADASGNVYVADTDNNRIVKFGKNGGSWVWGSSGSDPRMFDRPHAVAVSPDGEHIYVADTGNHRIQKLTNNGVFEAAWGKEGGPDAHGSGNKEFSSPKGICVDGAGVVYVADTGNERIQKFDKDGVFLGKWGSPGSEDGQFYEPIGIAASLDGKVYVADHEQTNNYVSCFDATGNFIRRFGGANGTSAGILMKPWGVAVDSSGVVYAVVQDLIRGYRVTAFSPDGQVLRTWGVAGFGDYNASGAPEIWMPAGLAILGTTNQSLLMCEPPKDRIREFSLDGRTLGIRGSWGAYWGRFNTASGVAVDALGNVIATSESPVNNMFRMNHTVQKFTSSGTFVGVSPTITPPAMAYVWNQYMDRASAVAVDSSGYIYVAEAGNNRIQKLRTQPQAKDPKSCPYSIRNLASETLLYQTKWGEKGTGDGRFNSPGGVACANVSGAVRVFVADTNNNRIQVFSSDGVFVDKWGTAGSKPGQLSKPTGIAVTQFGVVYVADTGNNRIQFFDVTGKYLGGWGAKGKPDNPSKFLAPGGVAVGPSGEIYVADTGNDRIKKFTAEGVPLDVWGSSGSDPGEFRSPRGLAVNSAGVIYVADSGNHRIQYFPPRVTPSRGVVINTTRSAAWVKYNASVTVNASLTDTGNVVLPGRELVLSTSHDGVSWSHVGAFTSGTGAYSYTQPIDRKTYFRWSFAGDSTYAASDGFISATSQASLTVPAGPAKAKRYASVAFTGDLKPRHAAGSRAVVLKAYRYENGKWVYRASGTATLSNKLGFSSYRGSVGVYSAGRWRVRAYHKDAGHAATYTGYAYLSVK